MVLRVLFGVAAALTSLFTAAFVATLLIYGPDGVSAGQLTGAMFGLAISCVLWRAIGLRILPRRNRSKSG